MGLSRRSFLGAAAAAGAACALGPAGVARAAQGLGVAPGLEGRRLSPWFEPLADGFVRCTLCPHACRVGPGETGACRVRRNDGGRYYSLVYGNPCAVQVDPIEKKPFFHVLPATRSLSLATAGCNFACKFCQNWEISQKGPGETLNLSLSPERVVAEARAAGAASIASTYVEPSIFFEYMLEIARLARPAGILKVMHSNGFLAQKPQAELLKHLDAACYDLKSSSAKFYQEICGGELGPVQDSLRRTVAAGVHTEIVHLMIPGLNDDPAQTRELIRFVRDDLGPQVPVHFTRFYPMYKLRNLPPTPVATLERAAALAREMGLQFAYVGNVPGHAGENTDCPGCGRRLITRRGYLVRENHLADGRCPGCGQAIYGLWSRPGAAKATT